MPTCRRRRPRSSASARRSEESVQPLAARSGPAHAGPARLALSPNRAGWRRAIGQNADIRRPPGSAGSSRTRCAPGAAVAAQRRIAHRMVLAASAARERIPPGRRAFHRVHTGSSRSGAPVAAASPPSTPGFSAGRPNSTRESKAWISRASCGNRPGVGLNPPTNSGKRRIHGRSVLNPCKIDGGGILVGRRLRDVCRVTVSDRPLRPSDFPDAANATGAFRK